MSVVFGLAEFKGNVSGLHLSDFTYSESASVAEAIDENGNIEQIDVYGKKKSISFNGNVVSGGSLTALVVGGTLTIGTTSYVIDKIDIREAVGGHKTVSGSASAPYGTTTSGSGGGSGGSSGGDS